jgi:molybdopterin/thiamine biosynthesis adenylyltransferase
MVCIAGVEYLDIATVEVGAEVKATVIVWLPEYECCDDYITQESGKDWTQNCCEKGGVIRDAAAA